MARKPSIWWRASRQAWFTKIKGKQIMLGTTREQALEALARFVGTPGKPPDQPRTVQELLGAWLEAAGARVTHQTAQSYRYTVKWFTAVLGQMVASEVRAHHVTAWLDKQAWCKSSRAVYGGHIRTAFQWATDQGLLPEFHLGRLRLGTTDRRRSVTEADAAAFRAAIQDAALLAWWDISVACGARPGELCGYREVPGLEARDLAPDFASATVRGKTGERTIYFPRHVRSLLAELARIHPAGPLLRNRHDTHWKRNMLGKAFRKVSDAAGVAVVPYHTRHIFATRSLRANGEIVTSFLTGHKSLHVLRKHYIALESIDLDEAIDRVKAG